MSYDYKFVGGQNNEFVFETDYSVVYLIQFKDSNYLFSLENVHISEQVFEFVIEVAYKPTTEKIPLDPKIETTVALIFKDFFERNENRVIVYICESADNKQLQRMKKFDIWFNKYHDVSLLKIDEILEDSNKNKFPISLILKNNHPHLHQIIDAFIALTRLGEK